MLAHPIGTLAVFIINWLFYLQCVFHTTIAINRYTMIVHSNGNWEKIWRGRNIRILIVFMIIIAMLPAVPRLWCNARAVNHDQTCDSTNTAVGNIITPVISTLTSIVSFSIELRTFVLFHRLGEAARRKRREDFRLLVYAVCQFVGQMLMTFQTIGTVISITFKLTEMRFYTKAAHSVVIAILCLSGPICLFSTSLKSQLSAPANLIICVMVPVGFPSYKGSKRQIKVRDKNLSIELPFVLFHVSVTVCIAWNIWKGRAALSTGFFLIYLVQSVCDLVSYALSVVFIRMPKIQAIPDPILAHPIGTLALFLINGLLYLQCIFHITIAINRYTMIVHPRSNWNQVNLSCKN
ncbi:serpentine type 7TM GPCR chemoreceptor srv domain-containing protein [Ditylenchus destructor]|nr:serpentine type 7TM GPCR chemoreceptor srv domain-containing protein [Ditylenchus destructor]